MKETCGLLAAMTGLLLAACGGGDGETEEPAAPPETYQVAGEESLPALTQEIPPIDMERVVYTPPAETDGAGNGSSGGENAGQRDAAVYQYSGLSDAGGLVEKYVGDLEEQYGCAVVTDAGVRTAAPDFSQPTGEVTVGKESGDQTGTLFLRLTWTEDACTVASQFQEGISIAEPEPLTLADAIERIQSCTPASLGLSGESMSDYYVWAEEGLVLVDGVQCIRVNVYEPPEYALAGTFLVAANDGAVYSLDRSTNEVVRIF